MSSNSPVGPDRGQPPNGTPPGQTGSSGYAFGSHDPAEGKTRRPRAVKGQKGPSAPRGSTGPTTPKEPKSAPTPKERGSGSRRGGATPTRKARRSQKSKKWVTIIAVVAAVVVVAGGAGAVLASSRSNSADPGGNTSVSNPGQASATSAPPAVATASDAVTGYLRALASGDAAAALAYSAQPVKSGGTLSNAVLAASNKRAKITGIAVPAITDANATAVDATYKLGDEAVSETFPVTKVADGWRLQQVVASVSLGSILDAEVPMKINGAAVTTDPVALFPGSYKVTSGLKTVTYGSDNILLVQRPSDPPSSRLKLTVTTAGKKIARSEARKAYQACLKQKSAAPKGCPFGLTTSSDSKVSKSTITWTASGPDPFKKSSFLLTGRSIGVRVTVNVTLKADCTKSGLPATCTGTVKAKRIGYVLSTNPDRDVVWVAP